MKKALLLILGLFIFQFACAETDPDLWNFGKVRQGEVAKHDFIFRNKTPKALKITAVNSPCGCTVSSAAKRTLKPGESTLISVSFNTKGYSGKVKKFVYVNTDNENLAYTKFTIEADVALMGKEE